MPTLGANYRRRKAGRKGLIGAAGNCGTAVKSMGTRRQQLKSVSCPSEISGTLVRGLTARRARDALIMGPDT